MQAFNFSYIEERLKQGEQKQSRLPGLQSGFKAVLCSVVRLCLHRKWWRHGSMVEQP